MRLRLAPLRERRGDIPALVTHFLSRHGNGHMLNDDVIDALVDYDWPGNVRELEHAVQHMVAMNSGPWISMAELPTSVSHRRAEHSLQNLSKALSAQGAPSPDSALGLCPVMPLADVERHAILGAVEYTKGDRTVAAALLGIGRTTLYRKLKEYGFDETSAFSPSK